MESILAWRQIKRLTQIQLGDKTGIDSNMISRYERGTATPSLENLKRLALGLGITVDELLNGPISTNWELRLITPKEVTGMTVSTSTIDLTGKTTSASLEMGDNAMGLTLSAGYEVWEDDAKFEDLISQLRKKRAAGLKLRKEEW